MVIPIPTTTTTTPNQKEKLCFICGNIIRFRKEANERYIRVDLNGELHNCGGGGGKSASQKLEPRETPTEQSITRKELPLQQQQQKEIISEQQPPHIFQYKISLKSTVRSGIEPDVTVYSDSAETVRAEAISLLENTLAELIARGFKVADILTAPKQESTT